MHVCIASFNNLGLEAHCCNIEAFGKKCLGDACQGHNFCLHRGHSVSLLREITLYSYYIRNRLI